MYLKKICWPNQVYLLSIKPIYHAARLSPLTILFYKTEILSLLNIICYPKGPSTYHPLSKNLITHLLQV